MGTTAARILLQRLRGQKDYPDHVAVVPELVIRESTMPPNPKRTPRHG
jgi:LacI family transcriptional regulator